VTAETIRATALAFLGGVALVVVVVLITAGLGGAALTILSPVFDLSGVPSTGNWIGRL